MRYRVSILSLGFLLVTAVIVTQPFIRTPAPLSAQEDPPIIVTNLPHAMIHSGVPYRLEENELTDGAPMVLAAVEGADLCEDAPTLDFSANDPGTGGNMQVNDMTISVDDPNLSCQWGTPSRASGHRTVWYRLDVPANGRINLETFNSNYDTVLAVYTGNCGSLLPVACDDDSRGFTSEVTINASGGTTYYIEVADWQLGVDGPAEMRLGGLREPVDTVWEPIDTSNTSFILPALSRHASVTHENDMYIIGGQTGNLGLPEMSNKTYRFDALTHKWFELADIPGPGYSNTTAVYANGRIFLPGGYSGNDAAYDGLHWVYDTVANNWSTAASIPTNLLPNGENFAWASAAVQPSQIRYFLTGGLTGTDPFDNTATASSKTYVYDIASDNWLAQPDMSAGRYGHTTAWLGNSICAAGGLSISNGVVILLQNGECFTPGGGSWSPIGNMNVPRYAAGSAVAPDGRWYIFGGFDAAGEPVSKTEYYDSATNSWRLAGVNFDLGGSFEVPARGWPRGGFTGGTLWVVGGSIGSINQEQPLALLERLHFPTHSIHLPAVMGKNEDVWRPDDTFSAARLLQFNIPQVRNFDHINDFYDVYTFELTQPALVTLRLFDMASDVNYDMYLYGQNKLLWASGNNPFAGQDEEIVISLAPRRYYVVVKRLLPVITPDPADHYAISIVK